MKPNTMRCRRCRGTGRVRLSSRLSAALDLVRANPGASATALARQADCDHRIMANRLAVLVAAGLVTCERDGSRNAYEVAP